MSREKLRKANQLNEEIERLENFIASAERVWTGKIVKRTSKFIIKSNPYGIYNEAEYELDVETKNKMLDVLKEKLFNLEKQLSELLDKEDEA